MQIPTVPPPVILPRELSRFTQLAYNLHWTWSAPARDCFALVCPALWAATGNPVDLLQQVPPERWRALAGNVKFLRAYGRALAALDTHLSAPRTSGYEARGPVAYFCMEYGWHECLPVMSGGLGVLAGDHTKTASDIGLPFVGVGMLYRNGFFIQRLAPDGRQMNIFPRHDFGRWPVRPVAGKKGRELIVRVELPLRVVLAKVWVAQVGRVPVLLLDTDVPQNMPGDRAITSQLYCRGREVRLCQERLIGIGGVRALRALGIAPSAWHLNEGHCVFLQIERLRELRKRGVKFDEARRRIAANTVFTTHTPVPAGNEQFDPKLVEDYFAADCRALGIQFKQLLELSRERPRTGPVNLTALALRVSSWTNGVSKLNAKVEKDMWRHFWTGSRRRKEADAPCASNGTRLLTSTATNGPGSDRIQAVTNGVHVDTWLGPELAALFDDCLGPDWKLSLCDAAFWRAAMAKIPDKALWAAHAKQKARLVEFCRERIAAMRARHSAPPQDVLDAAVALLCPNALTIGFARRFAPYKRADLLFSDPKRLQRIVSRAGRPVQFVFAGKAHHEDGGGQELVRRVFQWCERPEFRGRIVLLEEYDIAVARQLVQGVDVWLNNPQRPLEASGTSGQKAGINGAPNCSVLDGWWPEAYDGANGWDIGAGREFADPKRQARHDAASLYGLLERDIVPRFYKSRAAWIATMKASIATVLPQFNSERMLRDYVEQGYAPAAGRV
ncbi:MAG: alpha-glucan family phosphorylase [Verrucomicrobia bacterium]|nr:alpha-glucan family phosphorylase [Verrucomicrobiota bacterium]